ncbi:MAG TPA: hypothetical protein VFN57_15635 [Thermomicrobiaceae bacterium]|nr:hypothetical protein [Thermomicrobiaceae bacterium]
MKRALVAAVILAGLLLAIPLVLATRAAPIDHFQRDQASASFVSQAGCVRTEVDVTALSGSSQHGSARAQTLAQVHVALTQFNTCTGSTVVEAEGQVPLAGADVLRVAANLGSATLDATVPVTNEDTGAVITLQLHVDWTNPHGLQIARGHVRVPGGSADVATNVQGQDFSATATVTEAGVNLTTEPASFARISRVRDTGA